MTSPRTSNTPTKEVVLRDRWFRRWAGFAVLALLVVLVAGCGGDDAATPEAAGGECEPQIELQTLKDGELKVVAAQYPPLFTYQSGAIGGVDGEILSRIAERACLDLVIDVQSFAGVIESVSAGRADLAAGGWYITPDREEVVDQSAPAYSDPPVFVAKQEITNIDDVEGTIGTTQGYLWVDDLKQYIGDRAKLYQSPDAVFADVANGRLDAGLMAVAEASFRLEQNPDAGLKMGLMEPNEAIDASVRPAVTNFPHRKGIQGFTETINAEIARLRESGELADILAEHGISREAAEPAA